MGRDYSIIVPEKGYLAKVHALCKKHNVLLICDEVQTVSFSGLRGIPRC